MEESTFLVLRERLGGCFAISSALKPAEKLC